MRLIDADELAKVLRTNALSYTNSDEKYSIIKSELLNEIAEIIDYEEVTTTVYDVDKVIEQLKKASYNHADYGTDNAIDIETAISIVEDGGIGKR